jgi:hypothetical protein
LVHEVRASTVRYTPARSIIRPRGIGTIDVLGVAVFGTNYSWRFRRLINKNRFKELVRLLAQPNTMN